jgi:hypothetical protein
MSTQVTVKEIPHFQYYRDNNLSRDLWYTREEVRAIFRESAMEAHLLADNELHPEIVSDDEKYCSRGLEAMIPEGARLKLQAIHDARDFLLAEQGLQRDRGQNDPDLLADICSVYSGYRQRIAFLHASRDEQWMFSQLSPEERSKRATSRHSLNVTALQPLVSRNSRQLRRSRRKESSMHEKPHHDQEPVTSDTEPMSESSDEEDLKSSPSIRYEALRPNDRTLEQRTRSSSAA